MSRLMPREEYEDGPFEIGDTVEFDGPYGGRFQGRVVRVYNSGDLYHVDNGRNRYEVSAKTDRMRRPGA